MDPREKQSGIAAVYWYIDLQSLTDFLLARFENPEGDFSIDRVSIENKYIETDRAAQNFITENQWYNFAKISEGIWKIDYENPTADETPQEGEDRMRNEIIPEGKQKETAAICTMAIVFSKVKIFCNTE